MSLLNRAACKKYLLSQSANRRRQFTRVSEETLDYLESRVRTIMEQIVASHPSLGKTIYPEFRMKKDYKVTKGGNNDTE